MLSDENDPVNIGNPREMTIEEIARTIIRMTGAKSQIVYRPLPTDDPKIRQPDITRARTLLGWEPKVPLEEGLVKTIEYFRTKVGSGEPRSERVSATYNSNIVKCKFQSVARAWRCLRRGSRPSGRSARCSAARRAVSGPLWKCGNSGAGVDPLSPPIAPR